MFLLNIIENERKKVERKKNIKIAKNIITGLTIGTTLGILFAPQAGEETREDIKNKSVVLSNDIKNHLNSRKEDIESLKNTFSNIKNDIKERAERGISSTSENEDEYIDIDITIEKESIL